MCNVTMTYVIYGGRGGGGGGVVGVGRAIADCIRQYVPLATGLLCIYIYNLQSIKRMEKLHAKTNKKPLYWWFNEYSIAWGGGGGCAGIFTV